MKFWLIVFLFTPDGEYAGKDVYETPNKAACVEKAAAVTRPLVNSNMQVQYYCVSDDHYHGRKYDEGIPLD